MIKQRASSLILVLVVIASIMTITLGTQRVSLVQFAQSNREEDSLYALYAAKAGIEDGLARFRNYRDVETQLNKVFRFDLTAGIADNTSTNPPDGHEVLATTDIKQFQNSSGTNSYDPTHQHYDLNINFKTDQIGGFSGGGADNASPQLSKDDFFQLTGFETNTKYLRYAFSFLGSNNTCDSAFVQVQAIAADGTGAVLYQQNAPASQAGHVYDSKDSGLGNLPMSVGVKPVGYVRIRSYFCPIKMAFVTTTTSTGDGQIASGTRGPRFDGLTNSDPINPKFITRLTSTGYFGQAKRTLIGEIDRASGQLIGIYDFNAYAGGDIKRP